MDLRREPIEQRKVMLARLLTGAKLGPHLDFACSWATHLGERARLSYPLC